MDRLLNILIALLGLYAFMPHGRPADIAEAPAASVEAPAGPPAQAPLEDPGEPAPSALLVVPTRAFEPLAATTLALVLDVCGEVCSAEGAAPTDAGTGADAPA